MRTVVSTLRRSALMALLLFAGQSSRAEGQITAAIATTVAFCVRSILLGYFIKARIGVSLLWKGA